MDNSVFEEIKKLPVAERLKKLKELELKLEEDKKNKLKEVELKLEEEKKVMQAQAKELEELSRQEYEMLKKEEKSSEDVNKLEDTVDKTEIKKVDDSGIEYKTAPQDFYETIAKLRDEVNSGNVTSENINAIYQIKEKMENIKESYNPQSEFWIKSIYAMSDIDKKIRRYY